MELLLAETTFYIVLNITECNPSIKEYIQSRNQEIWDFGALMGAVIK